MQCYTFTTKAVVPLKALHMVKVLKEAPNSHTWGFLEGENLIQRKEHKTSSANMWNEDPILCLQIPKSWYPLMNLSHFEFLTFYRSLLPFCTKINVMDLKFFMKPNWVHPETSFSFMSSQLWCAIPWMTHYLWLWHQLKWMTSDEKRTHDMHSEPFQLPKRPEWHNLRAHNLYKIWNYYKQKRLY